MQFQVRHAGDPHNVGPEVCVRAGSLPTVLLLLLLLLLLLPP